MLFQERVTMTSAKWFGGILLAIAAGLAPQLAAQVQTDVPPAVAGAKPVTVEHTKIHGTALVDRDVLVFLPPSYAQGKSRRSGAVAMYEIRLGTSSRPFTACGLCTPQLLCERLSMDLQ